MGITMEPLLDSPPPSIATSQTAPSETTEGSGLPDDNALPDDIAKELEADDTVTTGDEEGKGDDDDVDAEVGDELLELLRDKDEGS